MKMDMAGEAKMTGANITGGRDLSKCFDAKSAVQKEKIESGDLLAPSATAEH